MYSDVSGGTFKVAKIWKPAEYISTEKWLNILLYIQNYLFCTLSQVYNPCLGGMTMIKGIDGYGIISFLKCP